MVCLPCSTFRFLPSRAYKPASRHRHQTKDLVLDAPIFDPQCATVWLIPVNIQVFKFHGLHTLDKPPNSGHPMVAEGNSSIGCKNWVGLEPM